MTFRLQPLDPIVGFVGVFYPVEDAAKVWRGYRDWAKSAPDEVSSLCGSTTLPASEHIPPEIHDRPMVVVGGVYTGDAEKGLGIMQPLRELGTPLVDISGPLPFTAVQAAFDPFFVRGTLRSYWKSTYVQELTDEVLDIVVEKAQARPSPRVFVITFAIGGAVNRVKPEDTAYSERSANWMVSIDGNWQDAAEDDTVVGLRPPGVLGGPQARDGHDVPQLHRHHRRDSGGRRRGRVRQESRAPGQDQGQIRSR